MEVLHVSLFAILVSFVFLLYKKKSSGCGSTRLPRGKLGWPVIGESLDFLSTGQKGHPEWFIMERMVKYSADIFKTHILGEKTAVFCGPSGNKFLFSNETKPVETWWPRTFDKLFPSSTESSFKEEAVKTRKMLPNFLKPESLQQYIGIMDQIAHTHFADEWENKQNVVVFPLAKKYTLWLACRLFLSIEDPRHLDELSRHFNVLSAGLIAFPIDFPGTKLNRAMKAANFVRKELLTIIKQRKNDLADGKSFSARDILSHMLLSPEEDGRFIHDLDVANKIFGLLIGGRDTASTTFTFIIKYLPSCLKSMRLFTMLYWNSYTTHNSPEFFPEPQKFDPSRFEGSGPAPYTYVPFGGGPRMCPGKEYARLQTLVFMHHLVKRFKWEKLIPDEKLIGTPMPIPAKGLPVRLFPHEANED